MVDESGARIRSHGGAVVGVGDGSRASESPEAQCTFKMRRTEERVAATQKLALLDDRCGLHSKGHQLHRRTLNG